MAASPNQQQGHTRSEPTAAVSVEDLTSQLRAMVRAQAIATADPPAGLLTLACVTSRASAAGYGPDDDGRTLALRDLLSDALDALDDGAGPDAARLLFGAVVDTRGRSTAERRRIAADALNQSVDTFRRSYEPRLVRAVAEELFRTETRTRTETDNADTDTDTDTDDADSTGALEYVPQPAPPATVARAAGGRRTRLLAALRSAWPAHLPGHVGQDAVIVIAGLAGWVWLRWGLDRALLVVVLPALAVYTIALIADTWRRRTLQHLPRLALVLAAIIAVASRLLSAASVEDTPFYCSLFDGAGSAFPNPDGSCPEPPARDTQTFAEVSPYYTETTHIPATEPVEPTCPPPPGTDSTERRTNFTGSPPRCIDPEATYIATVQTNFGDFSIELDTDTAPDAVNSFAFLAGWRYWDGTRLFNPRPLYDEALAQCEHDHGENDCPPRLDDYLTVPWAQALPPFDPDSDTDPYAQGPGYSLPVEPASEPHDTEPGPPHPVVFPYHSTTTSPNGDETQWVHPGPWLIAFSPTTTETLNTDKGFYTYLGELDDPDHIVSSPDGVGRITSAPIVIETVLVETPDQRQQRATPETAEATP